VKPAIRNWILRAAKWVKSPMVQACFLYQALVPETRKRRILDKIRGMWR